VRRAPVLIAILAATFALAACGKDAEPGADKADDTTTQAQSKTTATTKPKPVVAPRRTKDGCAPVAVPEPRTADAKSSKRKLDRKLRWVATMRTNCGTISIKLDVVNFPKTTRSFVGLSRSGFYDGLSFHRIAKPGGNDFVIQGGDPLGTGEGGPGYSVVESPKRTQAYRVGTVAMAKAGDEDPGTSGSQFFIVTGQAAVLDPVYAVIGRVISGGKVVRRIAAVPADPVTEMPIDPVVIKKVTVRSSKP
jgi:peptidyl-prolyl cis-trans isomerase B (cyclophilin B)